MQEEEGEGSLEPHMSSSSTFASRRNHLTLSRDRRRISEPRRAPLRVFSQFSGLMNWGSAQVRLGEDAEQDCAGGETARLRARQGKSD